MKHKKHWIRAGVAVGFVISIQIFWYDPLPDDGEAGPTPDVPNPTEYEAEARRLLGDLEVGDLLAEGWIVERVMNPDSGTIDVLVERGGTRFSIYIRPIGTSSELVPTTTVHHDLFISTPDPVDSLANDDGLAVLNEIAERVRANEVETGG